MLVIDSSFPAMGFNQRNGEHVQQVILHYTAAPFASSLRTLTRDGVSAHYLLPDPHEPGYRAAGYDELRVFRLVKEDQRAWHAGVSQWGGRDNLNSRSIGVEIVNQARDDKGVFTFPAYAPQQVDVLIALLRDVLGRYPHVGPTDILGHSDVAYWRMMYQRRFNLGLPPEVEVERAFQRYGYKAASNRRTFELRTRAFQMHFRRRDYGGILDAETCAILYALNEKYRGL
ncbi:N-acetylmuramoyl-L-alanine amidase [Pseudomonas sp. ABAC21]|nr:N-acetylmuramoyl-L-alanine amidase [Pseudomonas sp. ABAC21]